MISCIYHFLVKMRAQHQIMILHFVRYTHQTLSTPKVYQMFSAGLYSIQFSCQSALFKLKREYSERVRTAAPHLKIFSKEGVIAGDMSHKNLELRQIAIQNTPLQIMQFCTVTYTNIFQARRQRKHIVEVRHGHIGGVQTWRECMHLMLRLPGILPLSALIFDITLKLQNFKFDISRLVFCYWSAAIYNSPSLLLLQLLL